MPLLSFSIGLVGDGALAALPPCRLDVVRRLCPGIVMNSAYLKPSRGFQSHFIHTLTCVVSLVFFGQWRKGKRSSKICSCLVQSFS